MTVLSVLVPISVAGRVTRTPRRSDMAKRARLLHWRNNNYIGSQTRTSIHSNLADRELLSIRQEWLCLCRNSKWTKI